MSRGSELARCRAAAGLDETTCLIWFGVGLTTIERVEAGEVEPSEELEHKIDRFLAVAGGQPGLTAFNAPSPARSGGAAGGAGPPVPPANSLGSSA